MSNIRPAMPNKARSGLNRGLDVLELLAREKDIATLTEVARHLRMSKSGAHNVISTLSHRGYVERTPRGSYRLGLRAWEIGCGIAKVDLSRVAEPFMQALVERIDEGAILGVLDGADVVYIQLVESPQPVRVHAELGDRIAAHCTSTGLALLACLPSSEVKSLLPGKLAASSPETITDFSVLLHELRRVRVRGYAINRGGWRTDVGGVATAVLDELGRPVAGLCVAAPRYRMTRTWIARVAPAVLATAQEIADAFRQASGARTASSS
jgi:IclR family KDG regulon transcriptional repressor